MIKNEIDKRVALNIKRVREERGLSRAETEEGAGLSYGILAQIENLHKVAGKSVQARLAKYLKVSQDEFYKPVGKDLHVTEEEPVYLPAKPKYSRREREYTDKLLTIFRTKDSGTASAIVQVIDTFLKVPGRIREKIPG